MIEESATPGGVGKEEGTPGCVAAMASVACAPADSGGQLAGAEGGGGGGGGWLTGLWSSARSQSANMMGFMRRDLGEFVSVVRSDTKEAVQKTAGVVRESVNRDTANVASSRLKSGLNRFLDTISAAMVIPPDDSEEEALVYREGGWHPAKSRREGRILGLQNDAKTYEEAPDDAGFEAWFADFDVDAKKSIISDLLVANAAVRATYTRLVPSVMLHRVFWARYFFRLQVLEEEEARWEALKERAGRQEGPAQEWGDDWDEETPTGSSPPPPPPPAAPPVTEEKAEPPPADGTLAAEEKAEPPPADGTPTAEEKAEPPPADVTPAAEEKAEPPPADVTSAAEAKAEEAVDESFKVTEKADVVLVKHKDSPESSSDGSGSAGVPEPEREETQEERDLEEWEADLDVEVTAEEIEEAKKTARELKYANELDDDEDWENWE